MNKNTAIYIAGHTGLIGSAFLRFLKAENYNPIITATRKELDLTQQNAVEEFFNAKKPDIVILAAGRVGGIMENKTYPANFITTNLAIQLNVLNAAYRHNIKKLIFFGSSCMYPKECTQPMTEAALLSGKPEPSSLPYGMAKLAGVHTCLAYNQQLNEQRFIPVIPNTAYGPNAHFDAQKGHVLPALIKKFYSAKIQNQKSVDLWGTGNPRREFIFAEDIVSACWRLLQHNGTLPLPINIGTGIDYSIKELAELIAATIGYQGEIQWDSSKPDGALQKLLDSSEIHRLGWQPTVSLQQGIQKTIDWFLASGAVHD